MSNPTISNPTNTSDKEMIFDNLLTALSKKIRPLQLRQLKKALTGHLDRETIERITNGYQLLYVLIRNKLLSETKLAFFQKLLAHVDGSEKLLHLIKEFQARTQAYCVKEVSLKAVARELKSLELIRERHDVSLNEYTTMLEKLQISIYELLRIKQDQVDEIHKVTEQLERLKKDKIHMKERHHNIQQQVDEKRQRKFVEQDVLQTLQKEREDLQNKQNELQVKLNAKGESRLNTFQRTIRKEEINNTEKNINSTRKKVLDQKHLLMDLDDELDSMYCKLDTRHKKIRATSEEIQNVHIQLLSMYEKLQETSQNLVEIIDEQSYYRESITEISHSIETTYKEVELKKKLPLVCPIEPGLNATKTKNLIIEHAKNELNYKLLGQNIYTIGNDLTKVSQERLQQPISVNIDQNGDIVVADGVLNCILTFNIHGELTLKIDLNILQPVDMTVDKMNNYIVASTTMIRVYQRTQLLKQFLPLYVASKMMMPEIVSIDYYRHNDELLFLDKANKCIQMFTTDGKYLYLKDISESIDCPCKICILGKASFAVTDSGRHCINVYHQSDDGYTLRCISYGMFGIGLSEFVTPHGISCDDEQNLIVCDTGNHRVCILDCHGNQITSLGHLGTSKSCFNSPIDVALHSAHRMAIVADKDNCRLVVYL